MERSGAIREEELLAQMGWIRALAQSLLSDPGLAEDVAQDAWLVATERPPRARDGVGLKSWLSSVTRTLARQSLRSARRRAARERIASRPEAVASEASILERGRMHERVARLVMELEEPDRSTVLSRYLDGRTAAEIGRSQGVSAAAVRQRLLRALDRLRARLDRESGGDREAWVAGLMPFAAARTQRTSRPGAESVTLAKLAVVGGVLLAGGAAVLAAVTLAMRRGSPSDGSSSEANVETSEAVARTERSTLAPLPVPAQREERTSLPPPSVEPEPPQQSSPPSVDAFASELERLSGTFLTEQPDFDGLHKVLDEMAREAVVDRDTVVGTATGVLTGRFRVPGTRVIASFEARDVLRVQFAWYSDRPLPAPFFRRDVVLVLAGGEGGHIAQPITNVQFHPDSIQDVSKVLEADEERIVGWTAKYNSLGARFEPLTMRRAPDLDGWQIGNSDRMPIVSQPGVLIPSVYDDWYRLVEPLRR